MKGSIRLKFYSFISALLVILAVSVNLLPILSSRDAIFEQKRSSLTSTGNATASALSRLEHLNRENIIEVLRLLDLSAYSDVIVTDDTGTVIYSSAGDEGMPSGIDDISLCLSGKTVFRSDFNESSFDSRYVTPISDSEQITGAVFIEEKDSERASVIMSLQKGILTVTIIICIVALLLAAIFSGALMKRVSKLVSSMRTVADGDYSHRLEISGNDEITELGNEFNALAERLETNEAQRRRFVSDASHELKTPLASIRLMSDSIVQSKNMDSETIRDFVTDIGSEAERLQLTAEKLLDLNRLEDDIRVAPEPVDMKQVVIDAFVFVNPLAKEKKVNIKCDLEDGCIVMATVDDMFHIVFNLMENAVKYNVENGSVNVLLSDDDEHVTFTVKDTGIGIPEADRLNVFNRFYRVDKARSREAGGSGLGLAIVHEAVALHNGTITIGANKPHGSIFTVTFARATDEETGI